MLDRVSRGYPAEGQALLAEMSFEQAESRLGTVKLEASSAFVEKAEDMLGEVYWVQVLPVCAANC
ncbi:hypothetical protein [Streptomyces sp. NEAU-YJ-81]|uniref:hypothetical protein n=1 Tax=Streptomyces sp. NEAU-YJ-81 TaxID=2820288 RepID=UPI001ABC4915|nr:hypothetical protein [Streptomyces sp. NEAU-YJ-81]MBO3682641.1 hypothetical protein [Streptomyces sp. NEAU-YJ-81]